jgi:hypothetical protein
MTNITVVYQDFKLLSCLVDYFNTFSFTPLFRYRPVLSGKISPNIKNQNIKASFIVLVMLVTYLIPTRATITQVGTATNYASSGSYTTIGKGVRTGAGNYADGQILNLGFRNQSLIQTGIPRLLPPTFLPLNLNA